MTEQNSQFRISDFLPTFGTKMSALFACLYGWFLIAPAWNIPAFLSVAQVTGFHLTNFAGVFLFLLALFLTFSRLSEKAERFTSIAKLGFILFLLIATGMAIYNSFALFKSLFDMAGRNAPFPMQVAGIGLLPFLLSLLVGILVVFLNFKTKQSK